MTEQQLRAALEKALGMFFDPIDLEAVIKEVTDDLRSELTS